MAERHPLRILLAEDPVVNQKLGLRLLPQPGRTPGPDDHAGRGDRRRTPGAQGRPLLGVELGTPNGVLRDRVGRGMMLMRHREGLIELPPLRFVPRNPMVERSAPCVVDTGRQPLGRGSRAGKRLSPRKAAVMSCALKGREK